MKTIVKVLTLVLAVTLVMACCDRQCKVREEKVSESTKVQERLVKMKEQVVDKGSK